MYNPQDCKKQKWIRKNAAPYKTCAVVCKIKAKVSLRHPGFPSGHPLPPPVSRSGWFLFNRDATVICALLQGFAEDRRQQAPHHKVGENRGLPVEKMGVFKLLMDQRGVWLRWRGGTIRGTKIYAGISPLSAHTTDIILFRVRLPSLDAICEYCQLEKVPWVIS